VQITEPLQAAAARVLGAKCSLENVYLEQLETFGDPKRDPRTRVISVAYYGLIDCARFDKALVRAGDVTVGRVMAPWDGESGGPATLWVQKVRRCHLRLTTK